MKTKEKQTLALTCGFMLYDPTEIKPKQKSNAVFTHAYEKEVVETTFSTFELAGESPEEIFQKLFLNFVTLAANRENDGVVNEFAISEMQNRLINSLNSLNE